MKRNKIISGAFTWIPVHQRKSKFGGLVAPRKDELRSPVLWLARHDNELYLVNHTNQIFDQVLVATGGFQTLDNNVMPISGHNMLTYKKVKPDDAILLDTFDGIYDLDYLFQVSMIIQSDKFGCFEIRSPTEKGEIQETVLLWNTGEIGKNVYCDKAFTNL